jgi:hypothetical protein
MKFSFTHDIPILSPYSQHKTLFKKKKHMKKTSEIRVNPNKV